MGAIMEPPLQSSSERSTELHQQRRKEEEKKKKIIGKANRKIWKMRTKMRAISTFATKESALGREAVIFSREDFSLARLQGKDESSVTLVCC